jgi:hypothetical protein
MQIHSNRLEIAGSLGLSCDRDPDNRDPDNRDPADPDLDSDQPRQGDGKTRQSQSQDQPLWAQTYLGSPFCHDYAQSV